MNNKEFLTTYLSDLSNLLRPDNNIVEKLISVAEKLSYCRDKRNKIMIFGNGGSASIASHFSVDLIKNTGIRCLNFNEPDIITCFSNDYGYDRWVEKAVEFYGDEGDILILISSSGRSQNMINAVKAARDVNFNSVVTLTGFSRDNSLKDLGDINLWVNNNSYNFIENTHQIWLLSIVDLIIGSREYPA